MKSFKENLLVQFSVVSFVVMAVISGAIAIVLSNKVRSEAIAVLVEEAAGASSGRLLRAITPADLQVPMTGERYERFHEFVQDRIVSKRTARVKIWAKDGTVIYGNNPAKVGQRFPDNQGLLAALRGETFTELKIPEDAEHLGERHLNTLIEVYTPLVFPGTTEPQGALEFYQYFAPTAELIHNLRALIFELTGVGFIVLYAALVSILWRGWRTIVAQGSRLESFNAELAKQVQEKTAEIQGAQEKLLRTGRLAAIGELSAAVAHELRNPLGAIKNAVYYIKGRLRGSDLLRENPKVGEFLEILDEEIETSNKIVTDLMDFARVNSPKLRLARLEAIIDQALSRTGVKGNVKVVKELEPGLPEVPVDGEKLRRAFGNLIRNADEAMPEGGILTITARTTGGHLEVRFCDTGQGISDVDLHKVFDSLFTTKPRGIGMGLAIVKQIIEGHQGRIDVTGKEKGTTFTIRLPLDPEHKLLRLAR